MRVCVAVMLALIALVTSGCRLTGGRWVVEEETRCKGGVITTERRMVDTFHGGRVRNTTERTSTCLD